MESTLVQQMAVKGSLYTTLKYNRRRMLCFFPACSWSTVMRLFGALGLKFSIFRTFFLAARKVLWEKTSIWMKNLEQPIRIGSHSILWWGLKCLIYCYSSLAEYQRNTTFVLKSGILRYEPLSNLNRNYDNIFQASHSI